MPETPGGPDSGDAGLRAANARLRELPAEREAENAVLRELVTALQSQVADLAAQVKANSRNSSKPPSSDGPAKPAPKSLRGKSGRKPGRPKGQPGATMQLSDHPGKIVRHRPKRCGGCGKSLRRGQVTGTERRQVIDIPPVKAEVTEQQVLTVKCACGCETKAGAPQEAPAPVQYGPRVMGTGIYLWHGQFLSRDRACQALSEMFGCAPSPGALAAAARKTAGFLAPALAAITRRLIACEVVHFDETGFRTAGKLAWVHSASAGKFALFTVHAKRGKDGMTAAGVLPAFAGIAVHDAWAPYDTFENVAGHALCGAHVLRELTAVTETGTDLDKTWAQQAVDALLALDKAAEAARAAGHDAVSPQARKKHEDWYRQAAETGIALNAARQGKLQQKRHALATRMKTREADYLRFARDLRVPFTNNPAEQAIRMAKLRIKISGCMRSTAGAEEFCAIRSYLSTAARHGIGALDALTAAFQGDPWIPRPDSRLRHQSAIQPEPESRLTYPVTPSDARPFGRRQARSLELWPESNSILYAHGACYVWREHRSDSALVAVQRSCSSGMLGRNPDTEGALNKELAGRRQKKCPQRGSTQTIVAARWGGALGGGWKLCGRCYLRVGGLVRWPTVSSRTVVETCCLAARAGRVPASAWRAAGEWLLPV